VPETLSRGDDPRPRWRVLAFQPRELAKLVDTKQTACQHRVPTNEQEIEAAILD
jgi:hypothetical protein